MVQVPEWSGQAYAREGPGASVLYINDFMRLLFYDADETVKRLVNQGPCDTFAGSEEAMEPLSDPSQPLPVEGQGSQKSKSRLVWVAAALVAGLAGVYAARYLMIQFGQGRSQAGEPGDEFLIDSFEEGVFRQIQLGDYPQILVEDSEGKLNAYGCSDGCPPLDQDPDLYMNRHVRIYLRNQSTPGNDDPSDNGIKVVVRVELMP